MAKKKKIQETTIENYYDLRVDKVNELVAALKDDSYEFENDISMNISDCTGVDDPKNTTRSGKQKQFDPYKTDFLSRIPVWIKAIFVKWWFAGVICYFVNMGLGVYIEDTLDLLVVTGLVMGLIVDIMVNPVFKFMETDRREYDDYTMFPFPFKALWTLFANMIYYILVAYGVSLIYFVINRYITFLAMEPLLFGVFVVAVDMIFIGIKDGVVRLVKKLRKKECAVNV